MGNIFSRKNTENKNEKGKINKEKENKNNKEPKDIIKEESKINEDNYIFKYLNDEKSEKKEIIYFVAKDIEKQYIIIESKIQQICLNKNGDDNDETNNTFEIYLKKLKNISEKALDISIILQRDLFKEFQRRNKIFSDLKIKEKTYFIDPGCISDFSSWCKNNLINEQKIVEDFCGKEVGEGYTKEDMDIFFQITRIYLQCRLCNENIEFKTCKPDINFDKNTMSDLAELRGVNKKAKFCVLPGLFYNGNFIESGKMHVYCK